MYLRGLSALLVLHDRCVLWARARYVIPIGYVCILVDIKLLLLTWVCLHSAICDMVWCCRAL